MSIEVTQRTEPGFVSMAGATEGEHKLSEDRVEAQRKLIEGQKLKDLKVKNYLFQVIETILNRDTSKGIWDSMKQKYQGSTKVKGAQLQALRRDFETLHMKEGETVNNYFGRTLIIAN